MRHLIILLYLALQFPAFSQSLLIAAKEKGKPWGYINETGTYVIAPSFDDAGPFHAGVAVVKKGKQYGVINQMGEWVVAPTYEDAILYNPAGKITVKKSGKWGVISASGEPVIPFLYAYLSVFKDGYVVGGSLAEKPFKGKVCPFVLNEKADTVFAQLDCSDMPDFLPGFVTKKGYYSQAWPFVKDGKLFLESVYENEPVVIFIPGGERSTLNGYRFDYNNGFREGLFAARSYGEGDTWSGIYIDSTTLISQTITNAFPELAAQKAYPFFNGVAAIEQDGKWSFIDRQGNMISQTNLPVKEYTAYPPMHFNGLIGLFYKGKAGYVNTKGETIIPFQFSEYHPFETDVTPVKYEGSYGLLRKDGTWAVPPRYQNLYLSPCPCYQ
jgi:hypothetical protein